MAERPIGVTIVAALYLIGGVLSLIGALAILLLGGAAATMIPGMVSTGTNGQAGANAAAAGGFIGAIFGVIGIIVLVLAIITLLIGWFLLKGKSWARWVAVILSVLSLLGSLMPFNVIGIAFAAVVIYFLMIDKAGKAFFETTKA
jgi:cation transport ATPase